MPPQRHDKLASLRSRWFRRLSNSRQCLKITAALLSGCKEPPLSESELKPYIEDMLEILDCPPGDFLLDISPGQPFRLKLWHRLATFLRDPDADFLLQLPKGVHFGVNEPLTPSPAWPQHSGMLPEEVPLQDCRDSWKSAQDHPDIVQSLIQEELDAGFIAHVPGGVPQLKQMYSETAIGKLGVVLAPGRSPRLVVDSSISMVTANTVLPNHMLLPRISDIIQCAPEGMALQQMRMVNFTDALHSTLELVQKLVLGALGWHYGAIMPFTFGPWARPVAVC